MSAKYRTLLPSVVLMVFILFAAIPKADASSMPPPKVVAQLNLKKYMGLWYEIASFPAFFQRGCQCTTAHYRLLPKDKIDVWNRCYKGKSLKLSEAVGRAWRAKNDKGNSKLKVSFFWPFSGDYWVLYISKGYRRAVVGSPNRKYLWFLSRTPSISRAQYRKLLQVAKTEGYATGKLRRTFQGCRRRG